MCVLLCKNCSGLDSADSSEDELDESTVDEEAAEEEKGEAWT